jgi:hypothetical protein
MLRLSRLLKATLLCVLRMLSLRFGRYVRKLILAMVIVVGEVGGATCAEEEGVVEARGRNFVSFLKDRLDIWRSSGYA